MHCAGSAQGAAWTGPLTVARKDDANNRAHRDATTAIVVPDGIARVCQPEEAAQRVDHCGQAVRGAGTASRVCTSAGAGRDGLQTHVQTQLPRPGAAAAAHEWRPCGRHLPPSSLPAGSTMRSSHVSLGHRIDSHTSLTGRGAGAPLGVGQHGSASHQGVKEAGPAGLQACRLRRSARLLRWAQGHVPGGRRQTQGGAGALTTPGPPARIRSPLDTWRAGNQ